MNVNVVHENFLLNPTQTLIVASRAGLDTPQGLLRTLIELGGA
jgi:hypothetical protein